jgi:hypothetical protein
VGNWQLGSTFWVAFEPAIALVSQAKVGAANRAKTAVVAIRNFFMFGFLSIVGFKLFSLALELVNKGIGYKTA